MASQPVPGVRVRERGDRWEVRADHLGAFRRLITASVGTGVISGAQVRIDRWRRPHMGWTGTPELGGVDVLSVHPRGDGVEADIELRDPLDAAVVLSAVLRTLQPTATGFPSPTWTAGVPANGALAEQVRDVRVVGDEDAHVRRADVLLVPAGSGSVDGIAERTVEVSDRQWGDRDVLIDPTIHRPHGRASDFVGEIVPAADIVAKYQLGVDMTDVKPLRSVSAVTEASSLPTWLRAQLSALGVVLVESAGELPAAEDHLAWQTLSVDGRRDALREYSPGPAVAPWPTVSILLSTHRPERLEHALAMVRRQNYPHLQAVIVLHGDEDVVAQHAPRVRAALEGWDGEWALIGVPYERNLGHALAAASARADGELLTKMDDDDYYASTHVWDLVLARMYSGAQIVGKALDWVYLSAADTTVFRPTYSAERFARFVAGGTMLISAGDLAQVGGWRPVPRSVDRALLDRVLESGGLVYRTHGLGYVYVRSAADGSANTSPVNEEHFLTKTVTQFPGLLVSPALGTDDVGEYSA
jgi:hypothetical protein